MYHTSRAIHDDLNLFAALPHCFIDDMDRRLGGSPDPVTQKYLLRIQSKLQQATAAAAAPGGGGGGGAGGVGAAAAAGPPR